MTEIDKKGLLVDQQSLGGPLQNLAVVQLSQCRQQQRCLHEAIGINQAADLIVNNERMLYPCSRSQSNSTRLVAGSPAPRQSIASRSSANRQASVTLPAPR